MPEHLKKPFTWLAAILSGVLLALCFAPWELGTLVWVWPWPLLFALWYWGPDKEQTCWQKIRRGFGYGYLCGFVFFCVNSHWIFHTGKVAFYTGNKLQMGLTGLGAILGMGLYLGLYVGAFGVFANTIGRLRLPDLAEKDTSKFLGGDLFGQSFAVIKVAFLNAACWVGLEWLRSVAFTGYGWNTLGVALLENLSILQFADTIGQIGYGFVVMFCCVVGLATLVRFYREIRYHKAMRPHLDFIMALGMVMFLFLYGLNQLAEQPEDTVDLDIRIMQLNVPIEIKYYGSVEQRTNLMIDYRDFTRAFLDSSSPDLVMWSETALPTTLSYQPTINYLNEQILMGEDFHLLMGVVDTDVNQDTYNSITLMQGDVNNMQIYNKIHLVPFGEYIPGRDWKLPVFEWVFKNVISEDFVRGESYEPLTLEKDGHKIGVIPLICFEDTVAHHARKFVRKGPQFLANVSNDGWFYDSAEPHQHFASARFRCIELRRPMARCANTGVSGFIDETGSIYDRFSNEATPRERIIHDEDSGSTFIRGSSNEILRVDLNPPTTFYAKHGDIFSILLGVFALAMFGVWMFWNRPDAATLAGKN